MSTIGAAVRTARKNAGLTQSKLARKARIGVAAVRAVENGSGRLSSLWAVLKGLKLELRGRCLPADVPTGEALAQLRKRHRISRREMARRLDVSRNTLAALEADADSGLFATFEAYAAAVSAGVFLTTPDAKRSFYAHAANSSSFHGWETPSALAATLTAAVGGFDIDPCASTYNRKAARIRAKKLLTVADDGLSIRWKGKTFLNPPYGVTLKEWVAKAASEASRKGTMVIGLLPVRPSTNWWHHYVVGRADVFMLRGSLKFSDAKGTAPFPCCIVAWGASDYVIGELKRRLDAWHVPAAASPAARITNARKRPEQRRTGRTTIALRQPNNGHGNGQKRTMA